MAQILYKKDSSTWGNLALDAIYPIGSIYMSIENTSPSQLFGGTWVALENRMLIGASSTYTAGSTGGSATTTISSANLPTHTHSVGAHSHGLNSHKHSVGAHSHGLNSHTHDLNSHTHGAGSYSASSDGAHGHEITRNNDTSIRHWANRAEATAWCLANGWEGFQGRVIVDDDGKSANRTTARLNVRLYAASAGAHTHTVTGTSGKASGNTAAASGSTANSTAFDSGAASGSTANSSAFDSGNGGFANSAMTTISPYLAVYMWKRTA